MRAAAEAAGGAVSSDADEASQRAQWDALQKRINGLVNRANVANIADVISGLFSANLVRGRGLLCRSLLSAQAASPSYTPVYAALVAVLNTKLPELGELLLTRLVLAFRRAYARNAKAPATGLATFAAHLVNQGVAHELLALQLLTLLLERPTDDSVEIAIAFVTECGQRLGEVSPAGSNAIFERFRTVLQEGVISTRVQYRMEALFAERKAKFAAHPSVQPALDLVEAEDQIAHEVFLDDEALDGRDALDAFALDPDFERNEAAWAAIRNEILGPEEPEAGAEAGEGAAAGAGGEEGEPEAVEEGATLVIGEDARASGALVSAPQAAGSGAIADLTEADLMNLRRTIYLTIMNSLDFEEGAHKLMKLRIPRGAEGELCKMLIECCSQEKTYMRYYGLLGQRFCLISSLYQDAFSVEFGEQYSTIHRLETNKLRNVAKFFAHLLHTDALPWTVFACVHVTEDDTTSASRIFLKILLQELVEFLGLVRLRDRFQEPSMAEAFARMFPTDPAPAALRNTRFSINFFTSIGLGALTDPMREFLKVATKKAADDAAAANARALAEGAMQQLADQQAREQAERDEEDRRGRSRSRSYSTDASSYTSYSSRSYSSRSRSRGRGQRGRSPSRSSRSSRSRSSSYRSRSSCSSDSRRSRSRSRSRSPKSRSYSTRSSRSSRSPSRYRSRSSRRRYSSDSDSYSSRRSSRSRSSVSSRSRSESAPRNKKAVRSGSSRRSYSSSRSPSRPRAPRADRSRSVEDFKDQKAGMVKHTIADKGEASDRKSKPLTDGGWGGSPGIRSPVDDSPARPRERSRSRSRRKDDDRRRPRA
jgi:pre-mRNA-splicing factor CWC22